MRSMKFGENASIYLKNCSIIMCEYGPEERYWTGDPKVCGSRHEVFLSFDWSKLGSRKILSYKRKLPVGGSVKLGKVARRFTHFRMDYAI